MSQRCPKSSFYPSFADHCDINRLRYVTAHGVLWIAYVVSEAPSLANMPANDSTHRCGWLAQRAILPAGCAGAGFCHNISTIPHVSVARLEKLSELWMVIRRCCVTLHICKSVFRKSLLENVEVFRSKRRDGQHSLSYRYLWQVAFCVPVSHIYPSVGSCVVYCY